jgi:hypothetical protein
VRTRRWRDREHGERDEEGQRNGRQPTLRDALWLTQFNLLSMNDPALLVTSCCAP